VRARAAHDDDPRVGNAERIERVGSKKVAWSAYSLVRREIHPLGLEVDSMTLKEGVGAEDGRTPPADARARRV
jgi:hypothetical protein